MKILVIRFSSLGDVVLTTALYPNLRARWPESQVTVLTRPAFVSVFDGNPFVDHVRLFDPTQQTFSKLADEIRMEKFDVIIDLHGNLRSWIIRLLAGGPMTVVVDKATWARNMVLYFKRTPSSLKRSVRERILDCLKPLDVPLVHEDTQLYPQNISGVLSAHGIEPKKKLIGVAPGAKHKTKRWLPDRFADAANRLGAFPNAEIVILGDKSDREAAEQVSKLVRVPCKNLAGWTDLKELIDIMSQLSLLLTNDSGLMHVAEALKVPLVAVFGPTVRAFGFAPYRATSRVAEVVNLACRPCTLHGDERCPLGHHQCMMDIDVNAVLYVASDLLEEAQGVVQSS
ncbi:MAG: ADP-heptose--LPS heptosyltransferase 2 [Elusimicrobia bacterium]|nr:ADP-heptose--LPS heptosyltransferase 2 [Elusimicrobiota bacterium]